MKKTKLMFALLAGLTLGACSSDNDEQTTQQPPQPKSYPLTIEVTENPLVQDGEESSSRSNRAAITTTSGLTKFYLDYKYNSTGSDGTEPVEANKNGEGKWTCDAGWPGTDETVNWYAYTGGTFNLNGGTPYINFTVEENVAEQKDLLVATASGTYSGTGGKLSFTFDHACAALRFRVKKSTNISSHTLTVSSIVLKNVIKNGKYDYGTKTWTLGTNSTDCTDYTLFSGSAQTLASDSYVLLNGSESDSYLFLIPQTLAAWNASTNTTGAYISLTCTITKDATTVHNGEARIPFTKEFLKGKSYDVKINIGKNSLLKTDGTKIIND